MTSPDDRGPRYALADVEKRNRASNGGFQIPSLAIRSQLQPGQFAKLIFEGEKKGERMWVRVISLLPSGKYLGKLANNPEDDFGLQYGDGIEFEPRNVADIYTGSIVK